MLSTGGTAESGLSPSRVAVLWLAAMNRALPRLSCFSAAVLALAVSACASDEAANYPSLARRPAEQTSAAPVPAVAIPAPDPGLATRLSSIVEQAREAHGRFAARRDKAERLTAAASGAAMGSEGWSVASVALADLESARSETMVALADLDEIFVAARISGSAALNAAAARDQVSAWIGEEDQVLAALRGRLGG